MEKLQTTINKVFKRMTNKKNIHESILFVENTKGDFSYSKEYGAKDIDTPFLMASITKLCTTACVFMLMEQGQLSLKDPLSKYIQEDTLNKLHVFKGNDYSKHLTLNHLLSQTSGLRDALEEGSNESKKRALYRDKKTDFNEMIRNTKNIKPYFAPDSGGRAHYTNIYPRKNC